MDLMLFYTQSISLIQTAKSNEWLHSFTYDQQIYRQFNTPLIQLSVE